jgi:hypothetical protein
VGIRRRSIEGGVQVLETLVGEFGIAAVVDSNGCENSQMREGDGLGGALLVEAVSAISTMMLAVREREGCSASHTDVRVRPLRGLMKSVSVNYTLCHTIATFSYRTAINHAAGHGNLGGELVSISLQRSVHFANVRKFVSTFGCTRPRLYQLKNFALDFGVDSSAANCLEKRHQVVHKLAGGDLGQEMRSTILDTCIGKLDAG